MLKIALGQIEVIPGRPDLNTRTMLDMIEHTSTLQADLIIFPEMAVPGYFLGDLWEQPSFLRDCEYYGQQITNASTKMCIMFGNIAVDWSKTNDDGRVRKYNAFFTAYNGKLVDNGNFPYPYRIKTLQPNYREFDDTRHFFSSRQLAEELDVKLEDLLKPVQLTLSGSTFRVGCILCEDGWSDDYAVKPISVLSEKYGVDLFVNISSSPYTLGKNSKRNRVFSKQAQQTNTPLIYVNNTGIQNNGKTVYTFDGLSTVYNHDGEITDYCAPFQSTLKIIDLDLKNKNRALEKMPPNDQDISSIFQALVYGTKRFLQSINMEKVVIGVSGGIDSAVSAAVYNYILGPQNVLLVNMPSIYNSQTTKDLASKLAHNLGCLYTIIPIQESVNHTIEQIEASLITDLSSKQQFNLKVSSFVAENIQARDRSSRILAGVAAAFGGGFTCNANKSELTVGYSTLYGDQAGFLATLADLWKHQVYELAAYLNKEIYKRDVIPNETISIVPSAELSFDQAVDEGKGDPIIYDYHDYLFRAFMESWTKAAPEDILTWYKQNELEKNLGCRPGVIAEIFSDAKAFIEDLEKWWKLYTGIAVAKRIQAPPVLAISRRAYGFDHREAQNGIYFTNNYTKLKTELLINKC